MTEAQGADVRLRGTELRPRKFSRSAGRGEAVEEAQRHEPSKTRDAGTKIQGAALVKAATVSEVQQTAVGKPDEDAPMGFGHVQNQGNKLFKRVGKWDAATDVHQRRIGRTVREMGVRSDP